MVVAAADPAPDPATENIAPARDALDPPPITPHHGHVAVLRVRSAPPGCDVTIKGEPRGKTPVDIELPPNHRYDVDVLLPGGRHWRHRINLAPPRTEVVAR